MAQPSQQRRLQLLNAAQPNRPWHNTTECRRCIACDRQFHGTEVVISRDDQLACPGCGSAPRLWVRVGNPLLDNVAWADWQEAMSTAVDEPERGALSVG